MRLFLALALLSMLGVVFLLASSSCVIDSRIPDGGTDGEGGVAEASPPPIGDAGATEDGDAVGTNLDCGCCNQAVLPGVPNCTGKMAFEFCSSDCLQATCAGPNAYALCEGECFTACRCDLPAGYSLFDAGFPLCEAGASTGFDVEDAQGPSSDAPSTPPG